MQVKGSKRTLIPHATLRMARTLLITLVVSGATVGQPNIALADDAIGSGNGDLFHSKGWVRPEIYKKAVKPSDQEKPGSSKSTTASPSGKSKAAAQKKRSVSKRSRKVARRSSSKLRQAARSPVRKKARPASTRRVPPTLAKRMDRTAKQSVNLQHYAIKVASLGIDFLTVPKGRFAGEAQETVTGGEARIRWIASRSCLAKRLRAAIQYVALNFGRVRVNSTCRGRRHNRRVGGARRSWHLKGRAADIRVFGNIRNTARYLRRVVGGYKHYGGGLFHIDTGPRRRW